MGALRPSARRGPLDGRPPRGYDQAMTLREFNERMALIAKSGTGAAELRAHWAKLLKP